MVYGLAALAALALITLTGSVISTAVAVSRQRHVKRPLTADGGRRNGAPLTPPHIEAAHASFMDAWDAEFR